MMATLVAVFVLWCTGRRSWMEDLLEREDEGLGRGDTGKERKQGVQ